MHTQLLHSTRPDRNRAPRNKLHLGIQGTTLIEVLIAALIAVFVIAAGMQLFINQSKNHIIQAGITDMQQNGRVTIDELTEKIRQAGYMLPEGLPAVLAWDSNPDTIAVAFLDASACTASLSDPMPQPSAELKCTYSDVSCFPSNIWAYIHDPFVGKGEFFYITHVQAGSNHIQHNSAPLSKMYPAGSQIYILEFDKYYVDDSDPAHPIFMMERNGSGPIPYSDNIEDLQFTYTMADGTVADTISLDKYVRQVNIQVVSRTEKTDLFVEDYRRDTLSTSIQIRNLNLGG